MEHSRFCFSGDFNGQAAAAAAIEKLLSRSFYGTRLTQLKMHTASLH